MADVAAVIAAAASKIGVPYVWGAEGPNSFDCSGLTQWAWGKAGVTIPRTSEQQARYGTAVPFDKLQPGDLITSDWGSGPSSHVALYIGGGRVIHAPRPGRTVTYAKIDAAYRSHINAMRRVPGASSSGAVQTGFDPLDPLDILPGDSGLGSSLLDPLKKLASGTASMAGSLLHVGELATLVMKLALPSTWVRIISGVLGAMILLLGLLFLVRETKGG